MQYTRSILGKFLPLLMISVVPLGAEAQTPYSFSVRQQAYQPLPIEGGQAMTYESSANGGAATGDTWVMPVEMPFSVRYFDQEKSDRIYVSSNGWASFVSTTNAYTANAVIPGTAAPNDLIAPFWDDLLCTTLKSQILGTAPARTLIIEWPCTRWNDPGSRLEMQLWLYEGSSTLEIHYGSIVGTKFDASMGIEDATGRTGHWIPAKGTGVNCGTACNPTHWHADSVVSFAQGPELRVTEVMGTHVGYSGIPMPIRATVRNVGGKPANDFTMRFWVSPEPRLTSDSIELAILDGDVRSLAPLGTTTFEASPRLPTELEEGEYYILAEADPFLVVPDTNRGDNIGAFGPFVVDIRAANLSAGPVEVDLDQVEPGGRIEVSWSVTNTGNLPAGDISYQIVLSRQPTISPSAEVIAEGMMDPVASQASSSWRHSEAVIPEGLLPGHYYVGVMLDPHREIFEHDRSDNIGVSSPLLVAGDITITTESLPVASIEGSYSVLLEASGGDGIQTWSLKEGSSLPPGLGLFQQTGGNGLPATFLRGVPSSMGTFHFVLMVRSGGKAAEREFSLDVVRSGVRLTVSTENLAYAAFGFRYEEWLASLGGVPPYTWALSKGTLPLGVLLRSDGFLSGTPRQDGTFPLSVQVRDSQGTVASRDLSLQVSSPSALTCVTRELPPMQVGERVRETLLAAGGEKTGPDSYTWSTVDTKRLITGIGQESEIFFSPPPGLQLRGSTVQGEPSEIGTFIWTVEVRDAGNRNIATCPILVHVPADRGLSVVTLTLPTAIAGRSYQARLEASGGEGSLQWSELGGGRVLSDLGLSFDATGLLTGTPTLGLLGGEKEREFSFMVRVRDEANRIGVGALTLRLQASPPPSAKGGEEDGGCQAGAGNAGPLSIMLLGLVALRRRSR